MKRGFSLIELLIVVAIIVILVAILSPFFFGLTEKARIAREIMEIRTLKEAVMMYYNDTGRLPEAEGGYMFSYLLEDKGVPGWRGPYLNKLPPSAQGVYLTPWGTRFTFVKASPCWTSTVQYSVCNHLFINTVDGDRYIPEESMKRVDCEIDDCNLRTGHIYYTSDYSDGVIVVLFGLL